MSYLSFSLSVSSLSKMFSNLLKISKIQFWSILSKLNNDRLDLSTEKIKPHKHTRNWWLANVLYKVSSCYKLQLSLWTMDWFMKIHFNYGFSRIWYLYKARGTCSLNQSHLEMEILACAQHAIKDLNLSRPI